MLTIVHTANAWVGHYDHWDPNEWVPLPYAADVPEAAIRSFYEARGDTVRVVHRDCGDT